MSSLLKDSKLNNFERLETGNFYSIILLDGFNMIFMLVIILRTCFQYRVRGLTLWLLIGLELSVVFWVAANIKTYITALRLKQAYGTDHFDIAKENFIRG